MARNGDAAHKRFKQTHTMDERKRVSEQLRRQYPSMIPVIVEKDPKSDVPEIERKKFLVAESMTVGTFLIELRRQMTSLRPEQAIYLFVNNTSPYGGAKMAQLAQEHLDADGFLYITYSGENSFGSL